MWGIKVFSSTNPLSGALLMGAILSQAAQAGETEAVVRIPGATIQLTSPVASSNPASDVQSLAIFYISTNPRTGFGANINLQRQTFTGELSAFRAVSLAQFKTLGMTVLEDKTVGNGADAILHMEYIGSMQGRSFHWLAHAVKVDGSILLATCTTDTDGWTDLEPLCRTGLDSMRVKRD